MKRSIVALSAFALLAAACSTQASKVNEPAASPTAAQSPAAKPAAHVGDTLNLTRMDGGKIAVTLVQVINPATIPDGMGDASKTYVATKLTITDTGTSAIEGDANNNVALVGSDNQTYTTDFNSVTECTNFQSGIFHLGAGDSATGCVVFALPQSVTPVKVKYTPSAGFANDFGEWLIR